MSQLPQLFFGRGVFAPVHQILEELPFELTGERPHSLPHSIFEELWHLDYWQQRLLAQARGELEEGKGESNEDWPARQAPDDTAEWRQLLESIRLGLDEAGGMSADASAVDRKVGEELSARAILESLMAHNTYHLARVVVLRQLLGIWPPHGLQ